MKNGHFSRREFINLTGLATMETLYPTSKIQLSGAKSKSICIDCQSHLLVPDVVEFMKKRKSDPLVYEKN
ncbi:MAG: hypothetical protein E4H40_07320, partial [Candidatus Brocadiia bacterium]